MAQLKKQTSLDPTSLSYFLKTIFDFEYFLALSPFRLKYGNNEFCVETKAFQQLVCGICWILSLPWLFRNTRRDIRNTKDFLRFCQTLINATFKIITMVSLWTQSKKFCNIMNFVKNETAKERNISSKKLSIRTLAVIICVIQTILPLTQVVVGKGSAVVANEIQITNWTTHWWWSRTVAAGYYNFYFDTKSNFLNDMNNSASEYLIGILCAIGYYAR